MEEATIFSEFGYETSAAPSLDPDYARQKADELVALRFLWAGASG